MPGLLTAELKPPHLATLQHARMFRTHETVPPCEVKSEIIVKRRMVEIVVGVGDQPTEPFASFGPLRKQLDSGMTKDVSNHHEAYRDNQCGQLHWRNQQPERQKKSMYRRFQSSKGITGIGSGRDGLVVGAMKTRKPAKVK